MHELELPPDPTDPGVDGPSHVVVRLGDLRAAPDLTRTRRGMLTSLAVIVPGLGPGTADFVRSVTDWAPPEFRLEFVVVDPEEGDVGGAAELEAIGSELEALAWTWQSVPRPAGTRVDALDAATAAAGGEFSVIARGDLPDLSALPPALGQLWVHGGDILLVASSSDGAVPMAERDRRLAAVLGLASGGPDAVVVLRRWVARFLFDGLGRAIDPLEELLSRIQLLEVRLVEVVAD
jgi:hypothetical protein